MNQPQQPQYKMVELPEQDNQPRYGTPDNIQTYGSIIKDLTDTDVLLENYELKLRGRKKDSNGKIVDDPLGEPRMKTDRAARDFVDIMRSLVNRHNDFSYYSDDDSNALLMGANYTICRWLMLQGEEVPLRYRFKISFEAMSMIFSSTHKAIDGKMLTWTKGTFSEGMQRTEGEKKGIMDYIFPRRKRTNFGG